jgi:hypothetical protein
MIDLGMYYPWIRGHYCIHRQSNTEWLSVCKHDNQEAYLPENEVFLDDSLNGFIRPYITIQNLT